MIEWAEVLGFNLSPWEIILRGTLVYWFLFLLFRFVLRRDTGSLGIADVLLLVLLADASQNAMAGGYKTVPEGFLLVATLAGWSWLMDWGSYRFPVIQRFTTAAPLVLIRNGKLLARNLRREYISIPELMASLREQGIDKLAQVKIARMEADGHISIIRNPMHSDTFDSDTSPVAELQKDGISGA
jgi:uncharacterized membrane protein YcaP (DUF421 family)